MSDDNHINIHPILRERRSPYAFDPQREIETDVITALFEAARWTMSASNIQPWRYVVGVRGKDDGIWERVHSVLLSGNQPWTRNAPVLCLGVVSRETASNGSPNRTAEHDLGAASACLTVEAGSRGLFVHQMAGVDLDKAKQEFDLESPLEPFTALAIGYPGKPSDVDEKFAKRELRPRERKPLSEIIVVGSVD